MTNIKKFSISKAILAITIGTFASLSVSDAALNEKRAERKLKAGPQTGSVSGIVATRTKLDGSAPTITVLPEEREGVVRIPNKKKGQKAKSTVVSTDDPTYTAPVDGKIKKDKVSRNGKKYRGTTRGMVSTDPEQLPFVGEMKAKITKRGGKTVSTSTLEGSRTNTDGTTTSVTCFANGVGKF